MSVTNILPFECSPMKNGLTFETYGIIKYGSGWKKDVVISKSVLGVWLYSLVAGNSKNTPQQLSATITEKNTRQT